ncbi:PAS domain-containing protein, partial [Escherichia coli]|uniref:PAS domain-containing protein n=1 Tax=Escherichia coli TaxID=562 RepID=UPI003079A1BC
MTNDMIIDDASLFFNLSPDILCIFRFDGTFRTLNPAFTGILGWTVDEAMQKPWLEFIHPDDIEKTIQAAEELK